MNADGVAGYRLAREAQLGRFESTVQGVDRSDTGTPEYREYFGLGEYAGSGVEVPLTFRAWLVGNRRPAGTYDDNSAPTGASSDNPVVELVTGDAAFWLTGADLAALVNAGCVNAAGEQERRRVRRLAKRAGRVVAVAS